MAILDHPLVRDPRSQTQFLARLHLYLVAAPSNAACPPLAPQCTIDTNFDKAHVLNPRERSVIGQEADSSLGDEVHKGSCSEDIHMEEEKAEVKVQEEEVEDRERQ